MISVSAPKTSICRSKVNPEDMDELLKTFEKFRAERATELIRQNYLRRHLEETQSVLTSVADECLDRNKVLQFCINGEKFLCEWDVITANLQAIVLGLKYDNYVLSIKQIF